jgi:membrane-associated phospholipid phosphatase
MTSGVRRSGALPGAPPAVTHRDRSLPRRAFVVTGVALIGAALVLGWLVRDSSYPTRPDQWGWQHIPSPTVWRVLDLPLVGHAHEVVADLFPIATPGTGFALGLGLAIVNWWRRQRRLALFCLLAPGLALAVTEWVLKPLVGRTLRGGLAYPSGHTTASFAAGTLLILLSYRWGGLRRAAVTAALWLVPVATLVLYLLDHRLHYPTDMLGGVGIGIGVPLLVAAAMPPGLEQTDGTRGTKLDRADVAPGGRTVPGPP